MLITIDPPYRLGDEDTQFVFKGWAQVGDPNQPRMELAVNGVPANLVVTKRPPRLEDYFPGIDALSFYAQVDLVSTLRSAPAERIREPFLLEVTLTTDGVARTFEYAVTEEWLRRVFGRPMTARKIPPEHLQIRVSGAAAGGFHSTGVKVATQIQGLLAAAKQPLGRFQSILDFGSGPGRLIACMRDLQPGARLSACDIDAEAIAWARDNLGSLADFSVTPFEPPAPFPDQSFDLIYAISVFTHLPEDLQFAWLADLHRMLRPGGILLTTKMNFAAYDLPQEVKQAGAATGFVYWGDADLTSGLPDAYRLAYHSDAYVRREWGRHFEVLHIGAHDLNDTQDAVILRRRRSWLKWF